LVDYNRDGYSYEEQGRPRKSKPKIERVIEKIARKR
jgi:hypothetical protein